MATLSTIRSIFSRFQNLNLLALMHDLADDQVARRSWSSAGVLCPVAHGLAEGKQVQQLTELGQAADLQAGCGYAAGQLGAEPAEVLRFVHYWDEGLVRSATLLQELRDLWQERLADACAVQDVLQPNCTRAAASCYRA
jgi:hypothetical protein